MPGRWAKIWIIRGGEAAVEFSWLNALDLARTLCNASLPCFTGIGRERDSIILDKVAHRKFDMPSKVTLHTSRTIGDNALAAVAYLEHVRDLTATALTARHPP
jgi:exodeoxyribonuclease VII large subunit